MSGETGGTFVERLVGDYVGRLMYQREHLALEFTEAVAEAMQAAGIDHAELGRRLGRSASYVARFMDGSTKRPLWEFADVFTALGLEPKVTFQPFHLNPAAPSNESPG